MKLLIVALLGVAWAFVDPRDAELDSLRVRVADLEQQLAKDAAVAPASQDCHPANWYFVRHANRFQNGLTTRTQQDAVLIQEGLLNAEVLRDKFLIEQLPLEHIMLSQTTYSYQTVMPLAQATGIPLTSYHWGSNNDQSDFRRKMNALDPCPNNVLVTNHGAFLQQVLRVAGYSGPDIAAVGTYGRFYRFNTANVTDVVFDTYFDCVICNNQDLPPNC